MSKKLNRALDKIVVSDDLKAKIMKNAAANGEKKIKPFPVRRISAIAASFAILLCAVSALHILKPSDVLPPAPQAPQVGTPSASTNSKPQITPAVTPEITHNEKDIPSVSVPNAETPPAENTKPVSPPAETAPPTETENDLPVLSQNPFGDDDAETAAGGMQSGFWTEDFDTAAALSESAGFYVKSPSYLPSGYLANGYTLICGTLSQITYAKENEQITYRTEKGNEDISGDYNAYDITETRQINNLSVYMQAAGDGYHTAVWTDSDFSYSITCTEGIERDDLIKMIESIN